MKTLKIILLLVVIFSFPLRMISQNGIPYISFPESREGYEVKNWAVCQDDQNAMLFASREGILKYDGNEWSRLECKVLPRKIRKNPVSGIVYIIADKQYGYLERDILGIDHYFPLHIDTAQHSGITDVCFCDSSVIFYGIDRLRIYNAKTHFPANSIERKHGGRINGVFEYKGDIYLNRENEGLYLVKKDSIIKTSIPAISEHDILFCIEHGSDGVLLGLSNGTLRIFNGGNYLPFQISNESYLTENVLSDGLSLNDSTYAFSTLYGGAILVRKTDGKVLYTLNNDTGLPDDEIYAMGRDHANGLWLTYEFGTCRVDPGLPLRDFSTYPGLEGIMTNSCWYNNSLYVSTTDGLFYLSEVKNYEDVDIFFRRQVKEEAPETKRSKRKESVEKDDEKKRFLGSLFRRGKDPVADSKEISKSNSSAEEKVKTELVKRTVSKLKSIEYVYKKVEGINSRTEQFLVADEGLFCGASSGLFLVNNNRAELVFRTRNIHHLSRMAEHTILVGGEEGLFIISRKNGSWETTSPGISEPVFSAITTGNDVLWCGGYDICYRLTYPGTDSLRFSLYTFDNIYPEEMYLAALRDSLFLFSSSSVRYYSSEQDTFLLYTTRGFDPEEYSTLQYFGQSGKDIWLMLDQKLIRFGQDRETPFIWGLFDRINSCNADPEHGTWIIDDYSKLYQLYEIEGIPENIKQEIFIETISNEEGTCFSPENLVLSPAEKFIRIKVTAPSYYKNYSTTYQYKIEGRMEKWSEWKSSSVFDIMTQAGEYTIHFRAKNILGVVSEAKSLSFSVKAPFYKTYWFYLLQIPVILALLFLIFRARESKLKKEKQILEDKVKERTSEIREQKKQIEIQKDEILAQKNDITSSITYASRIQHAILPARRIFEKSFSDYFIFFRPRDIVSGDFYWITERNDEVIFAVADCTGHGVPGAFMSMLGNSFLNEITREKRTELKASDILNELRTKIVAALSQSGEDSETKDGMDIALCIFNKKKSDLQYSGAFNPLFLVRKGAIQELKADRMPIGYHVEKNPFTNHRIKVEEGDVIYLFSDGFHDQFGGPNGKKFTTRRFKEMLVEISDKSMKTQNEELQLKLDYWQRHYDQLDDILVLGVRV